MKIYLQKLIKRIVITALVLLLPIIIVGIFIESVELKNEWIDEDEIINKMNIQKLKNYAYGSNGLWLHNGEELPKKNEGTKRILIVGDSYIWGDGYSNANHMWWQQFKHILKEEGYSNVEVIAAGVRGYSTLNEFEFILKDKEMIEKVDPDFIILTYVNNDVDMDMKINDPTDFLDYSDFDKDGIVPGTRLLKRVFPNLYYKISNSVSEKFFKSPKFEEKFGKYYYTVIDEHFESEKIKEYEEVVIKPLKEYITKELQIPFIYYITTVDESEPHIDEILELFKSNEIEGYFCFDEMNSRNIDYSIDNYKINPVNPHPGVSIAGKYAECMLSILQQNYLDILGEKSGTYEPKFIVNDWMPYSLIPERIDENTYCINYPEKSAELSFLSLPVKKDYVKLNLEDPIKLNEIHIEGEDLKDVTVWINTINPELGYDDQVMINLGKQKKEFVWKLDGEKKVTSINISANIKDKNGGKLKITVK